MHEIGVLIWIVLLFIGVIGSMISSVRRRMEAAQRQGPQAQAPRPPAPQPPGPPAWLQRVTAQLQTAGVPPQAPPAPRPRPTPPSPPKPPVIETPRRAEGGRSRIFATRSDIVRGVIAAEVLGKPKALRDE